MARRVIRRFSEEQIERANRVDVVEYARSVGLQVVKNGSWHKAKGQGGLYFHRGANTWHWETHAAGGVGAVSLCMEWEQCSYPEAIKILLGEEMEAIRHAPDWKPEPEPPREFHLPPVNNTYKHMFAYLTNTRGIEPSVLKAMVDRKYVYENTQKSCVFVGRDKEGNARHASVRSTNTSGKVFKQDVPGSQKAYSFSVPGNSGTLNVFEAPIDLLSYVSMQKILGKQTNDSYIALGGVTDKALERFLTDYPNINKIRVCTDNDQAGEGALHRIYEKYGKDFQVVRHRSTHKDFNEDLIAYRSQQQQKLQEAAAENTQNHSEQPQIPDTRSMLTNAGISDYIISWYENQPDKMELDAEHFMIKGKSDLVYVCKDSKEVLICIELQKQLNGSAEYIPKDTYLVYSDIKHLNDYIYDNLNANLRICVCVDRTESSIAMQKEIANHCVFSAKDIVFASPQLNTFAEDLALSNSVTQAIEQKPLESCQQMAVGMEM